MHVVSPSVHGGQIAEIGKNGVYGPDVGATVTAQSVLSGTQACVDALTFISGAMFSGTGSLTVNATSTTINAAVFTMRAQSGTDIGFLQGSAGDFTMEAVVNGTTVAEVHTHADLAANVFVDVHASDGTNQTRVRVAPTLAQVTGSVDVSGDVRVEGMLSVIGRSTCVGPLTMDQGFTSLTGSAVYGDMNVLGMMAAGALGVNETVAEGSGFNAIYYVVNDDCVVACSCGQGPLTVQLPPASARVGRVLIIVTDGTVNATNHVAVKASGSDWVLGVNPYTLTTPNTGLLLISSNNMWLGLKGA